MGIQEVIDRHTLVKADACMGFQLVLSTSG